MESTIVFDKNMLFLFKTTSPAGKAWMKKCATLAGSHVAL